MALALSSRAWRKGSTSRRRTLPNSAMFESYGMSASRGLFERQTESIYHLTEETALRSVFPTVHDRCWDGAQLLIEFADTVGVIVAQQRIVASVEPIGSTRGEFSKAEFTNSSFACK